MHIFNAVSTFHFHFISDSSVSVILHKESVTIRYRQHHFNYCQGFLFTHFCFVLLESMSIQFLSRLPWFKAFDSDIRTACFSSSAQLSWSFFTICTLTLSSIVSDSYRNSPFMLSLAEDKGIMTSMRKLHALLLKYYAISRSLSASPPPCDSLCLYSVRWKCEKVILHP